jgi:hypothetical protein
VSLAPQFWASVDTSRGPDACWPWIGAMSPAGRGEFLAFWVTVPAQRFVLVLRLGRDLRTGEMPAQSCRTPNCCNPMHVRVS